MAAGAMVERYVLVERIGRGVMGEVWVAIDPDLDRKVALKLLRRDRLEQVSNRERMLAEARAMARLTHPHVVTIHDVGEADGQLFIAMEYVDGESLEAWLARGPYPWQEALEVLRQAGAGLAAAHDVGLVHRNFKPTNVIIGSDGRVCVLDFGLQAGLTRQTTPHYMSPEQHRGEPADAHSDMFSFCVVLFEALYGARPFAGSDERTVRSNIIAGNMLEIAAEERAPAWVHRVVVTGLANDPDQRLDDMQLLLRVLERSPAQTRRRRRAIAVTLSMGTAILVLVLALAQRRHDVCDPQAAHTQVWGPELRVELGARIDRQTPAGSLVGQRLTEGLDRVTTAWSEASAQLCRDRRATRTTPRLQLLRQRCLDQRREAITALTGVALASDDADPALLDALVARPFAGLRSLGDPRQCLELGTTSDDTSTRPGDRADARALTRLALALEPAGLRQWAAAELARDNIGADGGPEHQLLLGQLAAAAGDHEAAELHLHAVARATIGTQQQLAVQAWRALVELELQLDSPTPPTAAARLLDYAAALADPSEPALHSQLALLWGRLALALDQPELALARLDDAIERAEFNPTRDPDLLAALLDLRASLHASPDTAAADRSRAQAVLRAAVGPS